MISSCIASLQQEWLKASANDSGSWEEKIELTWGKLDVLGHKIRQKSFNDWEDRRTWERDPESEEATGGEATGLDCGSSGVKEKKNNVIAAGNKHAVPGDWNPLRSAEQADNRQKMLGKAAGLKSEADP